MNFDTIYDVSPRLGRDDATYPGDPPSRITRVSRLADGADHETSRLDLSCHAGAHLDAPAHFVPEGATIDLYPASRFILPAVLVEAGGRRAVGPEALEGVQVPPGGAILFRTDNSALGLASSGRFQADHAHLTPEVARACLEAGASLVGIDYLSVDPSDGDRFPVHHLLLGAGALILEGLDLFEPPPGPYMLVCLPLRLWRAEASPVRAVLLT